MEQIAGRVCAHISEQHWGEVYTHQSIILLSFKHAYRPLTHEYTIHILGFAQVFPELFEFFKIAPELWYPDKAMQSPQSIIPRVANLPRVSYPSKSVF